MQDTKRDALRGRWIVMLNVGRFDRGRAASTKSIHLEAKGLDQFHKRTHASIGRF